MNEELTQKHLKLWAVVKGPIVDDYENTCCLVVLASGPDEHEKVREVNLYFSEHEESMEIKKQIDFADEPIIRELGV